MIIKVTKNIFIEAFYDMGRSEQFSYEALCVLFDYLDEYEQEPDLELDVVALCCEFSEYESIADYNSQQGTDWADIDALANHTSVIEFGMEGFRAQDY